MKKKVGVVLSGCGVYDGSEIHEAVFTLLAIDRNGAEAVCMAPDMEFAEVNHLTGEATGSTEKRSGGSGQDRPGQYPGHQHRDGRTNWMPIIFPGGYGAAKNLCDFAEKGAEAAIHPEVARLLREMAAARKPICAICIAPALVAATLGREYSPKLTIGTDAGTAGAIAATGSEHVSCPVTEFVVDRERKIVSTPAYMLAERISEAAEGIDKAVKATIDMI